MNSKRSLYVHRVAVAEPKWDDVAEPQLVDTPGEHLQRVGFRARKLIKRVTSDEFAQPQVLPLPKGTSFLRDFDHLHRLLPVLEEFRDGLQRVTSRPDWAALEYDQAKKLCLQRGASPMWWVEPGGYVAPPAPSLAAEMRLLLSTLGDADTPEPRYKLGTNHGYPDYLTTTTSFVMHTMWATAAGTDIDEHIRLSSRIAHILDEADTPLSMVMFNRAGPLGKTIPGFSATEEGAIHDVNLQGVCCRRRAVNGIPSALNMAQRKAVGRLQLAAYAWPARRHFGPQDVADKLRAAYRPGWIALSDDISGFDKHVSPTHQRDMDSVLYTPVLGPDIVRLKAWARALPLLSPPVSASAAAFTYRRIGTTASGDLTTALDGSFINEARVLRCISAASGLTLQHTWHLRGTKYFYLIQGDDTVILAEKGFLDEELYQKTSDELGYPYKLQPGAVFLMHLHDPKSGAWTPLASRVLQQTLFNEYGGESIELELFAWMSRTPESFWRTNPWALTAAGLVAGSEAFREWNVTPRSAKTLLRNPLYLARLEQATRASMKAKDRFRNVLNNLDSADHQNVSAVAVKLLGGDDPTLPTLAPPQAEQAALALAHWMATPREARAEGTPNLGSHEANAYLEAILSGNFNKEDDNDD